MTTTDTPRTDSYQYANYILNHYDHRSHKDKLSLAKSLIENGYGSKAEVERLRSQLKRSIEITEETWELEGYADKDLKEELGQIKEEIK